MKRLLKDYRLHEHTEVLFLLTLGIIIQVLDGSPLDMWDRWSLAWETEFPREFFSSFTERVIKTVLSVIIFVRCLTSALYVLFGIVTFYCILMEVSAKLMLPWLFISGVKSVLLTFLETLTGVYVCSAFGKIRKPCVEFIISKAIELFFAIYLWACICSIHSDLKRLEENVMEEELLTKMVLHRVNLGRRRARSMIDETTLYKTANLNRFELKDVPNIIFDMLKTEEELSVDSLLSPGMMLTSVSNMGSYDYLKTSLSLGELGYIDTNSFQVVGLDDDRCQSPCARAMKFLKLTVEDIRRAKQRTERPSFEKNYVVPEKISWNRLEARPSSVLMRHQRCCEVYMANLPNMESMREVLGKKSRTKKRSTVLSPSLEFDTLSETSIPAEESRASLEEELIVGRDEGDADEEEDLPSLVYNPQRDGETSPNLWFMTNRKDEVNRIAPFESHGSKRADNYERLYRQSFMSVIGPEVFDRESRLVKMTSLSDAYRPAEPTGWEKPGTSQEPDPEPPPAKEMSEMQPAKRNKSKKIAFQDTFKGPDNHTTMPLSIIVTNFPVHLDSRISKSEAIYQKNVLTDSAEIKLISNRARGPGLDISGGGLAEDEARYDKMSEDSRRKNRRRREVGPDRTNNNFCYSMRRVESPKKVDLFLLKYGRRPRGSTRSERLRLRRKQGRSRESPTVDLTTCKSDRETRLPSLRTGRLKDLLRENLRKWARDDSGLRHTRAEEEVMFIEDLMKKPIKEVLRSYYDLRELESSWRPLRRMDSSERRWRTGRRASPRKSDARREASVMVRRQKTPPGVVLGSHQKDRTATDDETQVCFTINGLRSYYSMETVALGNPTNAKLSTSGDDTLPSMYLFGNDKLGWSSCPVATGVGHYEGGALKPLATVKVPPDELRHPVRDSSPGEMSPESDASCKMVLPPRQLSPQGHAPPNNSICSDSQSNHSADLLSVSSVTEIRDPSISSFESDESFSLFYSKTADLASPLFDTRRFIYPDHIHYSYKNVRKKGFDVELNRGLPLLVRDSLTLNPSMTVRKVDAPPDPQTGITRRPMDLTFAYSDAFASPSRGQRSREDGKARPAPPELPPVQESASGEGRPHSRRILSQKKEQKWWRKFGRRQTGRGSRNAFHSDPVDLSSSRYRVRKVRGRVPVVRDRRPKKKIRQRN